MFKISLQANFNAKSKLLILGLGLTLLFGIFYNKNEALAEVIYQVNDDNVPMTWGRSSDSYNKKIAQEWTIQETALLNSVNHAIYKKNSPGDNVRLMIYRGGTLPENGQLISSTTVANANIPFSYQGYINFPFASPVELEKDIKYFFVWERTGSPSDINCWESMLRNSDEYAYSQHWNWVALNGGWTFGSARETSFQALGEIPPSGSSIDITFPTSGSTASTTFEMALNYDMEEEDWEKIMIVFENWDASSTCPEFNENYEQWKTEYDLGYFKHQTRPFFSDLLSATSGTSTINVFDIKELNYNCVFCYFINETEATISPHKCPEYTLNVSGIIYEEPPIAFENWDTFYGKHSDEKYATSTALFTKISSVFDNVLKKVSPFFSTFKTIFDSNEAKAKGTEYGSKIPEARGYLKPINDFFGSLPISEILIFCLLILIIVAVYRQLKVILHLIRG